MRDPVTNSQSILTQYTDVMTAIGSLLDNMYPDLVLIMDQRMVAGEYLTRTVDNDSSETSDVEIDKGKKPEQVNGQPSEVSAQKVEGTLPAAIAKNRAETSSEIVLGDQPVHQHMSTLPSNENNQAAENGAQAVTRTISKAVTRKQASGRSSMFRKERIPQETVEDEELASSLGMRAKEHEEGMTQLLRRSARLADKQYSSTEPPTRSAIIKLRQTADQALFLASEPATAKVPVCCFELKGPKLNYTGLSCDPDYNENDNDVPLAAKTYQSMPAGNTSEQCASEVSDLSGDVTSAIFTSAGAREGSGDRQGNNVIVYVPKASLDCSIRWRILGYSKRAHHVCAL